jgi:AcrR family transcriptional regulator
VVKRLCSCPTGRSLGYLEGDAPLALDNRDIRNTGDPSPTYQRLLDTAAAMFKTTGYTGTSTRQLAALIGVQNASLYHHIRKKEDLLYDICVDSLKRITDAVVDAISDEHEPVSRLRSLIFAHVTTSLSDRDKHATMLIELRSLSAGRRQEVIELRDLYEKLVESVIREAQAAELLRTDISTRQLTLTLLNQLNWTIFWFREDGALHPAQLASDFASLFLDGSRRQEQNTIGMSDREKALAEAHSSQFASEGPV